MADREAHLRNRDGAAGVRKSASAGAAGHTGGDAAEGLKARLAARRRDSSDAPHPACKNRENNPMQSRIGPAAHARASAAAAASRKGSAVARLAPAELNPRSA